MNADKRGYCILWDKQGLSFFTLDQVILCVMASEVL
jgi:hypothetical protein